MKQSLLLIGALVLAGCSIIQPAIEKGAEETARLVDQYCEELDEQTRSTIREEVNEKLNSGNRIEIKCGSGSQNGDF